MLFCVFLLSVLFSVSPSANANGTFINYDDYATYTVGSTEGVWNVSATFPRDWFGTHFWTAYWGSQIGYFEEQPTFSIAIPSGAETWCMQVSPLGGMLGGWVDVGTQLYSNSRILDLSLIPDNTAFLYKFTMDYGGDVSLQAAGSCSFRIACVDSSGVVTSIYCQDVTPVQDGYTVTYSGTLTPNYYDDSAAGIIPYFYIINQGVVWPTDSERTIDVSMDYFRLSFSVSDAVKQAQEDARSQQMLSNIESALEDQGMTMEEILDQQQQTNDKLDDVNEGIAGLPGKIMDGIKDLFVPNAETIAATQDKWTQLLEDRFGAVYESIAIIDEYAAAFTIQDVKDQIEFPRVTVPLAGTDFVFGGWMVDVVPDGFEFLIEALKLMIDVACTFLFVNGMKKRLDRTLEG